MLKNLTIILFLKGSRGWGPLDSFCMIVRMEKGKLAGCARMVVVASVLPMQLHQQAKSTHPTKQL